MSAEETGWLVELKGTQPTWLENVFGDDTWTADASKAIRFARKRDAEHVIAEVGWTEAFASEHIWCDGKQEGSDNENR